MKLFSLSLMVALVCVVDGRWAECKDKRPVTRSEIVKSPRSLYLAYPGKEGPIDYEQYGTYMGIGNSDYQYIIKDRKGLAAATGEGIYPNESVFRDPQYLKLLQSGRLKGSHWSFIEGRDSDINFYKWASTPADPGLKQFFVAVMFERAGLIAEAIKAFHAVAVHFPKTVAYIADTDEKIPRYLGPEAINKAEYTDTWATKTRLGL